MMTDLAAIVRELTPTPLDGQQQATARLAFDHALQGRLRLTQYRVHELADRSLVEVVEAAGWLIAYCRDEQKQRATAAVAEALLDANGADERPLGDPPQTAVEQAEAAYKINDRVGALA